MKGNQGWLEAKTHDMGKREKITQKSHTKGGK